MCSLDHIARVLELIQRGGLERSQDRKSFLALPSTIVQVTVTPRMTIPTETFLIPWGCSSKCSLNLYRCPVRIEDRHEPRGWELLKIILLNRSVHRLRIFPWLRPALPPSIRPETLRSERFESLSCSFTLHTFLTRRGVTFWTERSSASTQIHVMSVIDVHQTCLSEES